MLLASALAQLKSQLKKNEAQAAKDEAHGADASASTFFVEGRGAVRLTAADFKARGGEGSIYVRGATAYKIYQDPKRMPPAAKLAELSALEHPSIIRPLEIIFDAHRQPAGYTMRSVAPAYALCQLFPKAFRQRAGLTPEMTLALVRQLQDGVGFVHSRGMLIVDLNEMNFLVAESLRELFFIDVDSYQTASFPAAALMESVRDRHARVFTEGSDWFSFAVVSFQMFVGIHPYKGTYEPLQNVADKEQKLDARMRANISVLHAGVRLPVSCLPLTLIPPAYLEWYRAVFEEGRRLPPPARVQSIIQLAAGSGDGQPADAGRPSSSGAGQVSADDGVRQLSAGGLFEIRELEAFDSPILWHEGRVTITQQSIYFDGRRYDRPAGATQVVLTPRRQHLVVAGLEGRRLRLFDLTGAAELASDIEAEEITVAGGRLYTKEGERLCEVEFMETPTRLLVSLRQVGNVMMHSTRMFEGCALQDLLGAIYVSVLSQSGRCHQVRLRELDGYQLIDARLAGRVLVVVAARRGSYDRFVFRLNEDFSNYDVRRTDGVTLTSINFVVLESGVVVHLTDEDELEIFSQVKGSASLRVLRDVQLAGDARLFQAGAQALLTRGEKLFHFSLRR